MTYLEADEVIQLHAWVIQQSGGSPGLRDRGLVESAVFQPQATFGGQELNPPVHEKAAVLGFSLAMNHAFEDGNKRIAHLAMETFLVLNGFEIDATTDEQEAEFLRLAAGQTTKDEFTDWVRRHLVARPA